jgi:eukaryotic-like serine/threonine-protein kinase
MSERIPRDTGSPRSGSEDPRQPRADAISRRLYRSQVHERLFGKRLETLKIGRFILLERIGAGSMGEIYAAYDDRLDRKVAIKLLHDGLDTSPSARQRLLREAQTLARLSHPNVVHVYEVGEFQGRVFIAMEFVAGRTLREWLHTSAPPVRRPTMPEILRHFIAAGRGLEAAHDAGLVHRDFKPANVLIGDDGRARVVDFGLARAVIQPLLPGSVAVDPQTPDAALDDPELLRRVITQTTVGRLLGTPGYMSPEQLRGEEADHRSDQFSFCVALYEALHGKRPFAGDTLDQLRQTVQSGVIRESSRHIRVPASLHKAMLRGLSTDPDKRFADMATLLRAIEEPTSRRRPWAWLMVGAVVSALVWLLISGGEPPIRSSEPPDPCSGAGSAMDEVWNDERQERLVHVFARAKMTAGWEGTREGIEKYQRAWRATSVEACRATHVRGTRPATALTDSTACLERGRMPLDALLRDIEREDARALVSALDVLATLYAPDTCISPEYLANPLQPPPAAIAARVKVIREQLADAHNHRVLGYYGDAAGTAGAALEQARSLDYKPVLAEAEYELGVSWVLRGEPGDVQNADEMLERAELHALASGHDQLLVAIRHDLVLSAILFHQNMDKATKWADGADAAIERVGETPRLRAMQLRLLGRLAQAEERYQDAASFHEQALVIAHRDPDYPAVWRASHLHELGTALRRGGQLDQAEIQYRLAIDALNSKVHIAHPRLAEIHFDLAALAIERGELDGALTILRQIVGVHERALGSNHRLVGKAHLEIAKVFFLKAASPGNAGDLRDAIEHLQLAYDIYRHAYSADHVKLAGIYELAGAIAYTQECPGVALAWYQLALDKLQWTWGTENRRRIELAYVWANIAEARLALGNLEGAEVAIAQADMQEAEKTHARSEVEAFIKYLRDRLEKERGTRTRRPAPTPEHCEKIPLVLKTSSEEP